MLRRSSILAIALALAVPAHAQPQPDWSKAASAEVVLSSFSFTPATLRLKAGVPVRLTLRNDKGGHNFSAPEFFTASRITPEDRAKPRKGKIELESGETVTIRLVPAAGTYKITCTHFLHTSFGMKGSIVVE